MYNIYINNITGICKELSVKTVHMDKLKQEKEYLLETIFDLAMYLIDKRLYLNLPDRVYYFPVP